MIYTVINGTNYVSYEGMTQTDINTLWSSLGFTGQVLSESDFNAGVAAQPQLGAR